MWVLRTKTELSAVEVALHYKQLWMVEQAFRTAKSVLDTRPIFHKTDATIRGHVLCSCLALVLRDELFRRMDNAGVRSEWGDILRDSNALSADGGEEAGAFLGREVLPAAVGSGHIRPRSSRASAPIAVV